MMICVIHEQLLILTNSQKTLQQFRYVTNVETIHFDFESYGKHGEKIGTFLYKKYSYFLAINKTFYNTKIT